MHIQGRTYTGGEYGIYMCILTAVQARKNERPSDQSTLSPTVYGISTRRRFAKALGANHLLGYYRSGGGSTDLRQVATVVV